MIKVNIIWNKKNVSILEIKGHDFIKKNEKLSTLCTIVSTIVLGGINYLNKKKIDDLVSIKNNNGYSNITVINSNEEIQNVLKILITQLQTIELYFKKGINIKSNQK